MEAPDANHRYAHALRRCPPQAARNTPDDAVADALLCAAGQGDERALGALYDRTAPAIYGLLRGILKEQALAERATELIYRQMWRAAPRFDPDHGSARSLLLRAAHRELIHHIRGIIDATTHLGADISPPERD